MAVAARTDHDRSLGRLLKDLSTETVTLLRQEIDLAKTEMREKIAKVATIGRAAAIGGGLACAGALALLAALILGLVSLLSKVMSAWVAMWIAPLIVGLLLAGIGHVMLRNALNTNRQSLVPYRTAESLQENQQWLKSKIR